MTDLMLGELTVTLAETRKVKAAVLDKLEHRSCIDPVAFVVPVVNEVFRRSGVYKRAGFDGKGRGVKPWTIEAVIAYARMIAVLLALPEGVDAVEQPSKKTVFRSHGKQSWNARHGQRMQVSIAEQLKGYRR